MLNVGSWELTKKKKRQDFSTWKLFSLIQDFVNKEDD